MWEQLVPDLRSKSGAIATEPCVNLEHSLTTAGLLNIVREELMVHRNDSGKELHNVVIRIKSYVSSSPQRTDEKFLFIPTFTRSTRIELSGNMYGQIHPVLNLHLQNVVPPRSRPAVQNSDLLSIPAGTRAFTLSIWSNELQRESIDLVLQSKPKVDAKSVRVAGGPVQVETKITHHFTE